MIFVTGGAGFIGANFILDWLRQSDEEIVNIDKLTMPEIWKVCHHCRMIVGMCLFRAISEISY